VIFIFFAGTSGTLALAGR